MEGLGTRLVYGGPGNETSVWRVWERDQCTEGLGTRLVYGGSGNETNVRRVWERD